MRYLVYRKYIKVFRYSNQKKNFIRVLTLKINLGKGEKKQSQYLKVEVV